MLLNPGSVLGDRYEIIEKIGSGGMAVVYRGKDKKLDRYVTIKVLREEFIGDEEFIERFRSEACSAARLSHPNIVRVYDVGEDGEINYIVMEYIHGDTLKTAIRKKAPFDSRSTINVAIQIASALSQAHKAHIVHRDIKPQNILVGTDGVVKVTDFGIARAARATTMTTTANAAGSVHYFSPEQARGGYVDEKSDIYSLGITMFEMITGVLPFQGNNSVSIALKHINEELPDIRQYNPNCSPSLEGIIKKATMKKADERYASIDLLLADLMRARTEVAMHAEQERRADHTEKSRAVAAGASVGAASAGIRMSRRAEAAKELREAQERAEAERARIRKMEDEAVTAESPLLHRRPEGNAPETAVPPTEEMAHEETRKADESEIDLIRFKKNEEEAPAKTESELEGDVNTPLVSFEKYGKRLKISKEDNYEGEYMAVEEVKKSRRPERKRRNPRKEEEYDNERDRKAERRVIAAAIVTAIVIIFAISAVGLRVLGGFKGFGSGEKDIATPTFIGMTYEEAEAEAEKLGLKLVKEGEDYSSYYDEGEIFWQNVDPETMVAGNTKIGVKVSIGLKEQDMPDVLNKSENDAKEAIIKLVGTSPDIVYEENDEVKPGHVISQNPEKGTTIDAHTKITLTISKPEEGGDVLVPDVQGETESSATQSLEAVGLTVGNISYLESNTVAEGLVIRQTLTPNSEVPSGSIVNLVISSGAPAQEEPPVEEEPPREGGSGEPADSISSSTQYFTITAPEGAGDTVHVKVVKTDANGTTTVIDETRNLSDFPFSIAVTGSGSGTITGTVDGQTTLSENVTF